MNTCIHMNLFQMSVQKIKCGLFVPTWPAREKSTHPSTHPPWPTHAKNPVKNPPMIVLVRIFLVWTCAIWIDILLHADSISGVSCIDNLFTRQYISIRSTIFQSRFQPCKNSNGKRTFFCTFIRILRRFFPVLLVYIGEIVGIFSNVWELIFSFLKMIIIIVKMIRYFFSKKNPLIFSSVQME